MNKGQAFAPQPLHSGNHNDDEGKDQQQSQKEAKDAPDHHAHHTGYTIFLLQVENRTPQDPCPSRFTCCGFIWALSLSSRCDSIIALHGSIIFIIRVMLFMRIPSLPTLRHLAHFRWTLLLLSQLRSQSQILRREKNKTAKAIGSIGLLHTTPLHKRTGE
jgi:hypothetical protein